MVPLNDLCSTFLMTQELQVHKWAVMSTPECSEERNKTRKCSSLIKPWSSSWNVVSFTFPDLEKKKETDLHFGKITEFTVDDL